MGANNLAHALGGRKTGSGWIAHCPCHDDRTASLSIGQGRDGTILICCHAGCDPKQVISALKRRDLWHHSGRQSNDVHEVGPSVDRAERTAAAIAIWQSA